MSSAILSPETVNIAHQRFAQLGLKLVFGKNIAEIDAFGSSSIQSRIEDLHWAFGNPDIKAILTVIGGFNSNQLLKYIDWGLIKNNPKIFCGYSDITALNNALYTKTGLVNYSGPHYSTFGQKLYFDYTLDYFKKCLFSGDPIDIVPSSAWSDDAWYIDQEERTRINNEGWYAINHGEASGTIIGANLVTFKGLQGTEYFPSLKNSILFIEEDSESEPHHVDRDLQSLLLLPDFKEVKGIVFGRFQKQSKMTQSILRTIITDKKELRDIPIIADVDLGHTSPMITFPIGGQVYLKSSKSEIKLIITKH